VDRSSLGAEQEPPQAANERAMAALVRVQAPAFMPAGTIHYVGSGKGAELGTYIVEKGKPLLTLAK